MGGRPFKLVRETEEAHGGEGSGLFSPSLLWRRRRRRRRRDISLS